MSQDLKNRNEAVRRRGRRLAQEQVRRPREESRADAAARQESRDRARVSSLRADRPPEQGGTRPGRRLTAGSAGSAESPGPGWSAWVRCIWPPSTRRLGSAAAGGG